MVDRTKIYTVSQINSLIKEILENNLPGRLTITGQITDWKLHHSGHCYFSLKDEYSQLPCVMWRSSFSKVKFEPENGLAVLAAGYIDVYAPQGKYQFYVETMKPAGVGALQLAFEQMVKRLEAQGLFDEAHKKPLPTYPLRIGILTSESGAAVHDITDSIHNRWPCAAMFLYPVPVQGEGAAEQIAAALRDINRRNKQLKLDVLIVGRGGGSLEDLWAFNEEVLARAIYDSMIPIISAVGHEIDTTIADLVADARASTPTKAGVVAVPDMYEILSDLANKQSRLTSRIRGRLDLAGQSIRTILASAVFRNPLLPVRNKQQQLDEACSRLTDSIKQMLAGARTAMHAACEQIVRLEPHRLLARKTLDLTDLQSRAAAAVRTVLNKCQMQLTAKENLLAGLNPKSVLQRGYSITTRKKTGLLVRKPEDIEIGDLLLTELAEENLIESKVIKK
ncbi:MAG TPA: exodeoxyribonuclease VII large subunit [Sedimentisphaerales bacterium]|nr:exodeoxyribonuclease VII large subunit [Sedimentisphaerales bacterium]